MSRLIHRYAALPHAFQMSRATITVFVEGRETDSYVYGRLCAEVVDPRLNPFAIHIMRADELPQVGSGGKDILVALFKYLRDRAALSKSGSYTTLFFLDKDLDEIDRKKLRSQHVVYTPTYDVEGLIFLHGNVADAAAAALSMPPTDPFGIGPTSSWCISRAQNWMEWIALCLTSRHLAAGIADYGSPSRVNDPLHGPADPLLIGTIQTQISSRTGVSLPKVIDMYGRKLAKVRKLLREDRISTVFKGKWYFDVLRSDVVSTHARFANTAGFHNAIRSALIVNLDYKAEWAKTFRDRVSILTASV